MKFAMIGICGGSGDALCFTKASDYSDRKYEGVQLRRTKAGQPVIISQCRKDAPLRWKVTYGCSTVFFRTFDEAVGFCRGRGTDFVDGKEG